jgi:radical SAM-linked protein
MTHISPVKQRIQITFGKFDALKYTSNLDIAKVWERVLRRADLPIMYTQGFNTRPRIQLATALPLGITSECEIIDVSLRESLPTLDGVLENLAAVSPDGLRMFKIEEVPINSPALQPLVRSAEYQIRFDNVNREVLQSKVDLVLAADRIVKIMESKRRKTPQDLRVLIEDLRVDDHGDLIAHIAAGERGNLRPEDLVAEMGLSDHYYSIHRFRLYIDQ